LKVVLERKKHVNSWLNFTGLLNFRLLGSLFSGNRRDNTKKEKEKTFESK